MQVIKDPSTYSKLENAVAELEIFAEKLNQNAENQINSAIKSFYSVDIDFNELEQYKKTISTTTKGKHGKINVDSKFLNS